MEGQWEERLTRRLGVFSWLRLLSGVFCEAEDEGTLVGHLREWTQLWVRGSGQGRGGMRIQRGVERGREAKNVGKERKTEVRRLVSYLFWEHVEGVNGV